MTIPLPLFFRMREISRKRLAADLGPAEQGLQVEVDGFSLHGEGDVLPGKRVFPGAEDCADQAERFGVLAAWKFAKEVLPDGFFKNVECRLDLPQIVAGAEPFDSDGFGVA